MFDDILAPRGRQLYNPSAKRPYFGFIKLIVFTIQTNKYELELRPVYSPEHIHHAALGATRIKGTENLYDFNHYLICSNINLYEPDSPKPDKPGRVSS